MGVEWNDHIGDDLDLRSGSIRQSGNLEASARWSIDRLAATADVTDALTTQVMTSVGIVLRDGDVISKLAVQFGATAADTPTNWWFALYSSAATPALLGKTADQTTGAIAANAVKDLALASSVLITADGVYFVGIMVKASVAVPSLVCKVAPTVATIGATVSGVPVLANTSGSSLTTTPPATIASPTAVANVPLVLAH